MNEKMTKLEKYWILYDVGNSAFVLLVSTLIPIYYKNMASAGGISDADSTAYYSYALSLSTLLVAIAGPLLGAVADNRGYKKPLFTFCLMVGVIGCAALSLPRTWVVFLAVFVIARVAYSASLILYDAMLNDITTDQRMDNISSQGYAWGYIGSCIPFILSLALVLFGGSFGLETTTAVMIAFFLNALWWFLVTIPLLKNYRQIYYIEVPEKRFQNSLIRLGHIFKELKRNKSVLWFLVAFFFYIDGVYTIIEMATSYGKDVGIDDNNMLVALLVTQIVAFPFAILFGMLTRRFAAKKLISVCIIGYFGIALFALQLNQIWEFWTLAILVAMFQGAIQALSRSYFAKIIPKQKSSEYFGLYDIFGKGASFLGTLLMGISTQLFQTSKAGVVIIAFMFVVGWLVFRFLPRKKEIPAANMP